MSRQLAGVILSVLERMIYLGKCPLPSVHEKEKTNHKKTFLKETLDRLDDFRTGQLSPGYPKWAT
jgi:hypothetical protein